MQLPMRKEDAARFSNRLTDKQISERRQTALSLMPAGLLDNVNNEDIADLYAYLKSQ